MTQLDALLAAVIAAVWDGNVSRTARFYVDSAPGSQGFAKFLIPESSVSLPALVCALNAELVD